MIFGSQSASPAGAPSQQSTSFISRVSVSRRPPCPRADCARGAWGGAKTQNDRSSSGETDTRLITG